MNYLLKYLGLCLIFSLSLESGSAQINWFSDREDRAFLGVESDRISKEKAELLGYENPYGALIDRIVEESAAEEAGLLPFDYITGINNEELDWTTELSDLIQRYQPGDEARVHFIRQGEKRTETVVFSKPQTNAPNIFFKNPFNKETSPFLGVSENSDNRDDKIGVTVNIVNGSTAESLGLRDGDRITSINGYTMIDWSDISRAVDMMQVGDPVQIEYVRGDQGYEANGEISSRPNPSYASRLRNWWFDEEEEGNAFLGIYSESPSAKKAERLGFENPYGSYVTGILENSAAENAGLQAFDYVYGIDQYRVGENQSLTSILRKYQPGEEVTIHIIRRGKEMSFPTTLGIRSEARKRDRSRCEDPFFGVQPNDRSAENQGVRINVVDESTAQSLGLSDGDIITRINGFPMIDWGDIGTAVDMLEVGEDITVDFLRGGQSRKLSGKIRSYCDTYGEQRSWNFRFWEDDEEAERTDVSISVEDLNAAGIRDVNDNLELELPTDNRLNIKDLVLDSETPDQTLRLQFELPQRGDTQILIYNDNGRQVYNYDLGSFSGEFTDEIGLSGLQASTYYLHVRQGKDNLVQKIQLR